MLGILIVAAAFVTGQPAGLATGPVDAADNPELRAQVARQVRKLAADTLKVREQAEKQLLDMGPSILSHLPVPNPRMSNEQRTRLKRVGDELRSRQAVSATAGSKVTLNLDKVKLTDVLKQMEKQTGNAFFDYREPMGQEVTDPEITLVLENVPFFQAVDQVLALSGLTVFPHATDDEGDTMRKVALVDESTPGMWRRKHVSYDGAFRFEAINLLAKRGLRDSDESRLRLEIETAWEPRLSPISVSIDYASVTAELAGGEARLKVTSGGKQSLDVFGVSARFPIHFELPSRGTTKIKEIRGTLSALLPGRIETFRFEKLTNIGDDGVTQKRGDVAVILESVRKNQSVWEIRLRAKFDDDAGALQSHLAGWVANNEIYLESKNDAEKKIEVAAVDDPDAVASSGAGFMFVLDGDDDDGDNDDIANYHLVYKTPAALVSRDVTFVIKNLPLP